jgi:hypothetical protein
MLVIAAGEKFSQIATNSMGEILWQRRHCQME